MAAIMPCPACKNDVSMQASTCPKCGHPIGEDDVRRHNVNMRNKGIFVIVVVVVLLSVVFSTMGDKPSLGHAVAYQVLAQDGSNPGGRARIQAVILAPSASDRDQFAQTAMKAAKDLQKDTGAKVVSILLEPDATVANHGAALAIASYAPDGGGFSGKQGWTWQVEAADTRPGAQAIQIDALWWANRDKFQIPDGSGGTMTDESTLSRAIANHLGISADDVHLLYSEREKYLEK